MDSGAWRFCRAPCMGLWEAVTSQLSSATLWDKYIKANVMALHGRIETLSAVLISLFCFRWWFSREKTKFAELCSSHGGLSAVVKEWKLQTFKRDLYNNQIECDCVSQGGHWPLSHMHKARAGDPAASCRCVSGASGDQVLKARATETWGDKIYCLALKPLSPQSHIP